MKAAVATEQGLTLREIAQPKPKPNEVLVKVRAAALNRADLATARGIPHGSHGGMGAAVGLEWAGEVVATGDEVEGYAPGERVMCSGSGGYAEYAVSDWGRVNPMPDGMSFEQAASLPVALHNALLTAGRLRRGERVMIQGASSGVGLMLADRQTDGRRTGDRLVHQRRAPRASQGVWRQSRRRHPRSGLG
jgi:NADPH:quinone reductase